ncbi:MAG: DUF3795 domain-containing protein [Candidatus Cloacimonetes bacterium]|nr:DUF3795 domain-containing protein [Candidatus Cloacimonadota bacterium]
MLKNSELALVSPCGMYCAECSAYKVKDNPELMKLLVATGLKEENLPCLGCRAVDGNCLHLDGRCEQFICVEEHGIEMCYECDDFPCSKLNPSVDRANTLPHNMKMFNQCYIQNHGVRAWIAKIPEIRKRYYTGKITFGKGPLIDNE